MDRQLTLDESFWKITTTQSNRDHFVSINTNPLPEFEQVGDEWIKVYPIRYAGSRGTRNTWGL